MQNVVTLSSLALLPAALVLAQAHSPLAILYLASTVVATLYHHSFERRYVKLDTLLAWAVIFANVWLVVHTKSPGFSAVGIGFVIAAIHWYYEARLTPGRYAFAHAVWHIYCGTANVMFALGYVW